MAYSDLFSFLQELTLYVQQKIQYKCIFIIKSCSYQIKIGNATLFKCKSLLLFWSRLLCIKGRCKFFNNDFE